MALAKKEKRLLIICGIVAVGAGIYQFVIYPAQQAKKNPLAESKAAAQVQQAAAGVTGEITQKEPVMPTQATIFANWGRDPFVAGSRAGESASSSGGGSSSASKKLVLKGIFWKQGIPHALINDFVLAEGETQDGILVKKITGTEVICQRNNRKITLHWSDRS